MCRVTWDREKLNAGIPAEVGSGKGQSAKDQSTGFWIGCMVVGMMQVRKRCRFHVENRKGMV